MSYRIADSLEVLDGPNGGQSVRCLRCASELGASPTAWRETARVRLQPARAAGPLMAILESQYKLKQLLCPSCGALLSTELVEIG